MPTRVMLCVYGIFVQRDTARRASLERTEYARNLGDLRQRYFFALRFESDAPKGRETIVTAQNS